METTLLRKTCARLVTQYHAPRRRAFHSTRQCLATPTQDQGDFQAAPQIRFTSDSNQFAGNQRFGGAPQRAQDGRTPNEEQKNRQLLRRVRIVPASPSYFTATPRYTDDLLNLSSLLRKHQLLPQSAPGEAPRVAWKTYKQYRDELSEPVKLGRYNRLLTLIKRLNYIHPSLMPSEVSDALERYKRDIQPFLNVPNPIIIDEHGRARAVGRRKSSTATVFLVEGDGQALINNRSLTDYFPRLHDRESALWALKATSRLDKYNVWAVTTGGGTTGQAEAITLGVAKALLAHEPDLKPALRRAGVVTRDPRRVERKKAGKLKARKMPAWVKR